MVGIPSKKFAVWDRLYTRFALEPFPAGVGPDVLKTIAPVTDADELLKEYGADLQDSASVDAGATASFTVSIVPEGERWVLYTMNFQRNSGDNQITNIFLRDVSRAINVSVDAFSGTASRAIRLDQPLTMEEGDEILLDPDGTGVSASIFRMLVWLSREENFR